MSSQHETESLYSHHDQNSPRTGTRNIKHTLVHGFAFAICSTAVIRACTPLSLDCNLDETNCETNELIYLCSVAFSSLVFACGFAFYARSSSSRTAASEQSFGTLWKHSLIMTALLWFGTLWTSASFEDFVAITFFTFNLPFILMVPYSYAAYCHPTSPFGSWLHRAREAIQRREEGQRSGRIALRAETQPLSPLSTGGRSPREEHWKQNLASPSTPPLPPA